jgi:hypothetical protein
MDLLLRSHERTNTYVPMYNYNNALCGWPDYVSYAFEASDGQVINQSLGKRSITI